MKHIPVFLILKVLILQLYDVTTVEAISRTSSSAATNINVISSSVRLYPTNCDDDDDDHRISLNSYSKSNSKRNGNHSILCGHKSSISFLRINRGGGDLPNSSTFWSTRTNSPTSTSTTNSSRQNHQNVIKVTDVTNEIKDEKMGEAKEQINNSFALSRDDRNTFIARVYTILATQLLVTVLSIFLFANNPKLQYWMLSKGKLVSMGSFLISTFSLGYMSMSEEARRKSPLKWKLLTMFTLGEAILVGLISSLYKSKTVISALLSTAFATLSITFYTLWNRNPKYDLSQWGAGLGSIGMMFVFYGFIRLLSMFGILPPNFLPYNEVIYSLLGTGLFTLYLAYHTRLIISGKYTKYQLNEKDYVFGAMLLYDDIINIFLFLLRLMEDKNE